MLSVIYAVCHIQALHAECRYAECRIAQGTISEGEGPPCNN